MTDQALPPVQHCTGPGGISLAFRHAEGRGPLIVFLPGYMSDMDGSKATTLMGWAVEAGRACLLLDYSGCGKSGGRFADGTLSRWRDEVLFLIEKAGGASADRPVLLIGSSMGGWLMLLIAAQVVRRSGDDALAGLIGIAAGPDFTGWGFSDDKRTQLAAGKTVYEPNAYGPEPMPYHPGFFADAETLLIMDSPIAITAPTRLLQGQNDPDVPWQTALRIADALVGEDVQVHLLKDGDHRLSRESDLALLIATLEAMVS